LISKIPVESFFGSYWRKQFYYEAGWNERFSNLLTWETYEKMVRRCAPGFSQGQFQIIVGQRSLPFGQICSLTDKGGRQSIDLLKVHRLFSEGATLVYRELRSFCPSIDDFSTVFESICDAKLSVNLYHTPPNSQGFPPHCDGHEIFVVQLEGEKEWLVSDSVRFRTWDAISLEPPPGVTKLVVKRGDVLYIPKGYWHCARATDIDSLHMTFGLHIPTARDLAQALVESSSKSLSIDLVAFQDGELRISSTLIEQAKQEIIKAFSSPANGNELARLVRRQPPASIKPLVSRKAEDVGLGGH